MDFLSNSQILSVAPSIFGDAPKAGLSEKYGFVPTHKIVTAMQAEGFLPMQANQTRSRKVGNIAYAKHMIRFRHVDSTGKDEFPEVVLVNSHDGSSTFKLMAGFFRIVCSNGLIAGKIIESISVRHIGNIANNVIEGSYQVLSDIRDNSDAIKLYKSIQLSYDEQIRFAQDAIKIRWADHSPIAADTLLQIRRPEDRADDLWTIFNRAQENILRGGLRGLSSNNRRLTTRSLKSIDESVRVNRELWDLADSYAQAA